MGSAVSFGARRAIALARAHLDPGTAFHELAHGEHYDSDDHLPLEALGSKAEFEEREIRDEVYALLQEARVAAESGRALPGPPEQMPELGVILSLRDPRRAQRALLSAFRAGRFGGARYMRAFSDMSSLLDPLRELRRS
ncbi:MAG: hypothetical protein ACKVPX_14300 [Myxococcaceae bacterium]